jgi:hypothetical protein
MGLGGIMETMNLENEAKAIFVEQQSQKLQAVAIQQQLVSQIIQVGLKALSTQILIFLSLLLDAGMFGWAMTAGTWPHIAAAVLFAIATWCLVKITPHKEGSHAP